MSLADRLLRGEQRSQQTIGHPRDPIVASWFGGGTQTAAGMVVTPETAMQLSAVYACVRILATALASLPVKPYREKADGGREAVKTHPLYNLLRWQPNGWLTSFEWREMLMGHVLLRGNAYSYKEYRGDGALAALIPLHPDRTTPFWAPNGKVAYRYTDRDGTQHVYLQEEVLHIRGMSNDGLAGMSVIGNLRETIGLTLAAEQFGGRYFGNGTVVSGVLQTDEQLSDAAYERLKQDWANRHAGVYNAHRPAILEEGLKWQSLTVNPEDAQFLETRKFQVSEICRIFGVPPHMVADVSGSTSWGTGIEQQGIGFVVYALQPWLVRWEQAMKRDLLAGKSSQHLYVEFNVDGLLRGDSKARADFYKALFGMGAISSNEIRAKENMNPVAAGNRYYVPLNMADPSAPPPAKDKPAPADDDDTDPDDPAADDTLKRFHLSQLRHAIDRINACECKALERAIAACGDDTASLEARVVEFYAGHTEFLRRHLEPVTGRNADVAMAAMQRISLGRLRADFAAAEPIAAVQDTINEWRAARTQHLTRSLADLALEGINDEQD